MGLPELFHISEKQLPLVLKPRLMEYHSSNTGGEKTIYTEADIPRVSFSPTVYNCFTAVFPLIQDYMQSAAGIKNGIFFQVYKAKPGINTRYMTPEALTKKRYVWDAHATKEHWFLDPIDIVFCGVVKVTYDPGPDWLDLYPYDDSKETKVYGAIPPVSAVEIKQTMSIRNKKYQIVLYPEDQ